MEAARMNIADALLIRRRLGDVVTRGLAGAGPCALPLGRT